MSSRLRPFGLLLTLAAAVAVTGCSSNADELNGTWSGTDTLSNGTQVSDTVTLTANNGNISGQFVASVNGGTIYMGTFSGVYTSPNLTFTVTVPAGAVTNQPNCSLQLTNGTAIFVNSSSGSTNPSKSLTGSVTITPNGSCTIPATTDQFMWTMAG